jgi:hypothetical protein
MDYRTTSAAGLASSRGLPWVGKAAFAAAMLVVTAALAAWVVDFDVVARLRNPQATRSAGAFSFDDRFGSGSARKPAQSKNLAVTILMSSTAWPTAIIRSCGLFWPMPSSISPAYFVP